MWLLWVLWTGAVVGARCCGLCGLVGLVGWLMSVGWLVGWSIGWLVGWFGWFRCLAAQLVRWQVGCELVCWVVVRLALVGGLFAWGDWSVGCAWLVG